MIMKKTMWQKAQTVLIVNANICRTVKNRNQRKYHAKIFIHCTSNYGFYPQLRLKQRETASFLTVTIKRRTFDIWNGMK